MIFAGIQGEPAGYVSGAVVTASPWSPPGTTFVAGFNAILNISESTPPPCMYDFGKTLITLSLFFLAYTFIGQICYPSFIAEMKNPEDL